MSSNVALELKGITKTYHIYDKPQDRLKQMLLKGSNKKFYREFSALKDVSFTVEKGETVGIIGRNGSGKSTLLQIIAGTLAPSSGEVKTNGRVAALLELGSGFNPEFSGRENVYLYGSIYGITKKEMDSKFDDIAAFADIGEFIDQPVKTYSSGMFVRLAFSVAVNVDADILIVDEALSVGDMFFQAKCFDKLHQLKNKGVTLLFVSHSIETIKALCTKCVLLKNGDKVFEGDPGQASDLFTKISLSSESAEAPPVIPTVEAGTSTQSITYSRLQPEFGKRIDQRFGNGCAQFVDAYILNAQGDEVDTVYHGSQCRVVAYIQYHEDISTESEFGIVVRTQEGIDIYAINSFFNNLKLPPQKAGAIIRVEFKHKMILAPGHYSIALGLRSPVQGSYCDKIYNGVVFRVALDSGQTYVAGLVNVPGEITYKGMR